MLTPRIRISFHQQVASNTYKTWPDTHKFHSERAITLLGKALEEKTDLSPSDTTFLAVRVYTDGEAKFTIRDEAGVLSWLVYNAQFRGGNTLFVDCECMTQFPAISDDKVKLVSKYLPIVRDGLEETSNMHVDQMRFVVAHDEPSRIRYPDDRVLTSNIFRDAENIVGGVMRPGMVIPSKSGFAFTYAINDIERRSHLSYESAAVAKQTMRDFVEDYNNVR